MPEQSPVSDETVRMPADGGDGRPAASTTSEAAFGAEPDDTRPVPRDRAQSVPAAAQGPKAPPPAAPEQADDIGDHPTAVVPPLDGDGSGPTGGPPSAGPSAPLPRGPRWRRRAVLVPAGLLGVLAAVYGVDLLVASGDVPRSTVVAGIDIGGLSSARAAVVLEEELAPRVAADHQVRADDVTTSFSPAAAGIGLDVEATVDAADDQPLNPWTRLVTLFSERDVDPVLTGERTALAAQVEALAEQVDRAPVEATILIEDTTPSVVEPQDGRTLDRDGATEAITAGLASGADPSTPIELPVDVTTVTVDAAEAERVLAETVRPALAAPVGVVSQDGGTTAEVSVAALAASLGFTPEDDGTLSVRIDPDKLQVALGDELVRFGTPAQDATFQVSGGAVTVVPSVDGTGIDLVRLAEQMLPVLTDPAPRSVTAELGPVPAELTTQEAEALGIREEVSTFTTRISNPASGTNIRVVAEEVDGALIEPGETFSLNGYTGPRGTAQGYIPATVISGGQLSKAVGGGVSQFATTMFNAVFFAGLEDVYHKPHSFYIDRYPAGREATVYEGLIDLQWRNDGDTGIYVDTAWTPSSLTVTFYGTRRYEIQAIEGARTNRREPARLEKPDDGTCIPQSGVAGFDITVTRVFRDLTTGSEIKRERFDTRYAAEAVIRCVPEAPASAPAPEGTAPAGPASPGGRRPRPRAA